MDFGKSVEDEIIYKEEFEKLPEILQLWCEGYTYKEIAEKLETTVNSVRYRLRIANERIR